MTSEKVLELAKQAGMEVSGRSAVWLANSGNLQAFAQLVRNTTLEEAAKVCESLDEASGPCSWHYEIATQECATAIRGLKS